ncbi:MAG TPA: PDZ domain-containing protein [Chthoniobacter sp.]|nr:PDZ domain-containing protein [Chthoniobacter sp.]
MSASSRKVSVWLLVILLPAAIYIGWSNYQRLMKAGENELDSPSAVKADTSHWRFANEEAWLVDETARDIAELLAFAKNPTSQAEFSAKHKNAKGPAYELKAKVDGAEATIAFEAKEYIWSPADYTAWAQKLVSTWKLTPGAPSAAPAEFLPALTSFTPETLIKESKRLSAALTKAPLDASLHEQAALVTATFALHEAAGDFSDTRRELCRTAAHLAIARALQPQAAGAVRPLADAALQTLAGRENTALEALAGISTDAPAARTWVRALRLYNTSDWRAETDSAVVLEAQQAFRARVRCVGTQSAIRWISKLKPAPIHDWRRLVNESGDVGVEVGHGFAKDAIEMEISSLHTDWKEFFGTGLDDNQVVKALAEPAGRSTAKGAVSVLGWDLWSAQHQRHLCQAIRACNEFMRDRWGVPEFRDVQKFVKLNFSTLQLFPLLERELSEDPKDCKAISERINALIKDHPELVTAAPWEDCLRPCGKNMPRLGVGNPDAWFTPLLPFGTTYHFEQRSSGFVLPSGKDPWWTKLVEMAPYDYRVTFGQVWKTYGDHPPADVAEAAYKNIVGYQIGAMRKVADAQKSNPAKYAEATQRVCELDPDEYFKLGNWYVAHQQPEQAADAFQKGVELGDDRVHASNNCEWLVTYLEDHGKPDQALAVAKMAADVYSFRGLEVMASLMERRGKLKEAEDHFEKISERYEDEAPLTAFYVRQRGADPEYEKRVAASEKRIFPDGMQKAALADFQQPPKVGTILNGNNQYVSAAKLKAGDVVVALDGYRTDDMMQYQYIRSISKEDEPLKLIVWDGIRYRETTANPPKRRFGIDLKDLKK